jgi:hypothetical protein
MDSKDAQGRPELIVHPDIKRGQTPYRIDPTANPTADRQSGSTGHVPE